MVITATTAGHNMIRAVNDSLTKILQGTSEESNQGSYVDIHCHCLPAVDDGPATKPEAISLCRSVVEDGVTIAVATPHQLGRFNGFNEAPVIRNAVARLNEELQSNNIPLTVMPGGEIRLDERICRLLKEDKILTLADGGKYILLELPEQVFIDIEPLLIELKSLGVQAIISHAERQPILIKRPGILSKWFRHSAHLQITATSLLGGFGLKTQRAAWHFLRSGWVSLVATDAHDLHNRRPRMRTAFKHISIKMGEEIARLICVENPSRVVKGQNILMSYSMSTRKFE